MARKRTRQEKIMAKLRREAEMGRDKVPMYRPKVASTEEKTKVDFYTPELTLPLRLVSLDLTKSLIVTILALILQFSLAVYLNRGGWAIVDKWF